MHVPSSANASGIMHSVSRTCPASSIKTWVKWPFISRIAANFTAVVVVVITMWQVFTSAAQTSYRRYWWTLVGMVPFCLIPAIILRNFILPLDSVTKSWKKSVMYKSAALKWKQVWSFEMCFLHTWVPCCPSPIMLHCHSTVAQNYLMKSTGSWRRWWSLRRFWWNPLYYYTGWIIYILKCITWN